MNSNPFHSSPEASSTPCSLHPESLDRPTRADYENLLACLADVPRNVATRNARGVCLLRLGRYRESLDVYWPMALHPGTVNVRRDLPDEVLLNYASGLLASGLPSGCLDILGQLQDRDARMAVKLRDAIENWRRSLSFWCRMDWNLNRAEPTSSIIPVDFELGVWPPFGIVLPSKRPLAA
ncbi:MAG: tetratricopeptide repeat protein [Planctomycetota bacterium]